MPNTPWTAQDVPDQHHRIAVITGANTGLGFELADLLAQKGAVVVLACRSETKAAVAANRIRATTPSADVDVLALDQSSQSSVRSAAARLHSEYDHIDLLVNNAGILGTRKRSVTADGIEATFATNHLGPFALTGLLLDQMIATPHARIVTVTSVANRYTSLELDDLQAEKKYRRDAVYSRSKLANLMFSYELQRRLTAAGVYTLSVAAHPGQSRTEFTRDLNPVGRWIYGPRARVLTRWIMQDKSMGVLTLARAATALDVEGGDYYGPSGPLQLTGYPTRVSSSDRSHDPPVQRRLWDESERLTGVTYPFEFVAD